MRVGLILPTSASAYDAKCKRLDEEILGDLVARDNSSADILHIYGRPDRSLLLGNTPYVATAPPKHARFSLRRIAPPAAIAGHETIPEAVESKYWQAQRVPTPEHRRRLIGTFVSGRVGLENMIQQSSARISRFREDVEWIGFNTPPEPAELVELDAWVDPAVEPEDLDGFVAEALVARVPVIASRTPMNWWRLDGGQGGFLVPPKDPNELVHALLTALFKDEWQEAKRAGAAAAAEKFRPARRAESLLELYRSIVS